MKTLSLFQNMYQDMVESRRERNRWQREQLGNIPPGCWYTLILIMGIVMVGFGIYQMTEYGEAARWQTTVGRIITSQVTSETHMVHSRTGDYPETIYTAQIRYEYVVNGQRLVSDRIRLSEKMCIATLCTSDVRKATSPDKPQARVNQYPLNLPVTVRYDPADPQTAILERNISPFIIFSIGMGLIMIGIGAWLWWLGMKS